MVWEARSPHDAEIGPWRGGEEGFLFSEQKLREEVCGASSYFRYGGAFSWMH